MKKELKGLLLIGLGILLLVLVMLLSGCGYVGPVEQEEYLTLEETLALMVANNEKHYTQEEVQLAIANALIDYELRIDDLEEYNIELIDLLDDYASEVNDRFVELEDYDYYDIEHLFLIIDLYNVKLSIMELEEIVNPTDEELLILAGLELIEFNIEQYLEDTYEKR